MGVGFPDNRQVPQLVGRSLLLAVSYFIAAVVSAKFFYSASEQTGLWLANAVAVCLAVRCFTSLRLPLALTGAATLAANISLGNSVIDTVTYSATNLASVTLGILLLRRRTEDWRDLAASPGGYLRTLLLAGVLAPAIAGLGFTITRFELDLASALRGWWFWWSGDALGHAIVMPVILLSSRDAVKRLRTASEALRVVAAVATIIATGAVAITWSSMPFVIMIVPLMVAAAFLSPFAMSMVCVIGVVTIIETVVLGIAPRPRGAIYAFQISLAVMCVLPMLGTLSIQQIQRDRRRIAESEQRFRRAMKDSPIGVAIVSLDGHIVETNGAFADMLGYSPEELQTKTFMDLTHAEDIALGEETMRRVRAGKADSYSVEKRYMRKDGSRIWTQLAGSVIRDDDTGNPLYLVSQIENIDVRKTSEIALTRAETRWNFALSAAGQGVWDLDLNAGKIIYSATWKQMLGYGDHELDGDPDLWLTLIHPEDRERVKKTDREHMEGLTPMFEAEFRMQHREGHYLWILDRGQVVERNADGSVARAVGTLTDITTRRETEERILGYAAMLSEEKERLRVILSAIGDAVICTDAAERVTFMNPVAEKLTRSKEAACLGRPLSGVYQSVDEESGEKLAAQAEAGRVRHNSRAVMIRADGSRCSIREVISAITTDRGEYGGSVIVFQDFTDARTLQRELAHAATHDALTGLANRTGLVRLSEALTDQKGGRQAQFLFIDLDRFKAVNDTGGHAAGDALLKKVGDTISALLPPGDIAARLGGDEFAVILKSCTMRDAEAKANRIIGAVGALDFSWAGKHYGIGASIGIASLDGSRTIEQVIAEADRACYAAKASGRNCVCVAEDTTPARMVG